MRTSTRPTLNILLSSARPPPPPRLLLPFLRAYVWAFKLKVSHARHRLPPAWSLEAANAAGRASLNEYSNESDGGSGGSGSSSGGFGGFGGGGMCEVSLGDEPGARLPRRGSRAVPAAPPAPPLSFKHKLHTSSSVFLLCFLLVASLAPGGLGSRSVTLRRAACSVCARRGQGVLQRLHHHQPRPGVPQRLRAPLHDRQGPQPQRCAPCSSSASCV